MLGEIGLVDRVVTALHYNLVVLSRNVCLIGLSVREGRLLGRVMTLTLVLLIIS